MHLYSAICRKQIRGACWVGLGRVFMQCQTVQFQSMPETTERLIWPTVVRQWVPDRWGTNTTILLYYTTQICIVPNRHANQKSWGQVIV